MKLGVLGAGTMGRGITEAGLVAGFDVVLVDVSEEIAVKGAQAVEKSLSRGVQRGRLKEEDMRTMLSRLTVSGDMGVFSGCDAIIEAVYENESVKREALRQISQNACDHALIGSNTSSLSITAISQQVQNPERFLGIHFFNPVPVMKLVEIIPGDKTHPDTVVRARQLAESMGKTPVVVKESPGFIVNRLLCPMMNEAAYLLSAGVATAEDIDTAMKLGANHPIGPLALADLVGIDVLYAIMQVLYVELKDEKYRPCPLLKEMIDSGKLGRKSGQGFYKY